MAEKKTCKIEGCNGKVHTAGYCGGHYSRLKNYGDPFAGRAPKGSGGFECSVDGCSNKAVSRTYCPKHLARFKKYGDPLRLRSDDPNKPLTWIKENANYDGDDCLKWPFSVGDKGRGMVWFEGRRRSAPNCMCTIAHGEAPSPEHVAAHSCGNGHLGCMNPKHLRWATAKENEADKIAHGTLRRGSDINTSKLTAEQVLEIRSLRGVMKGVDIAKRFGITPAAVSSIQTRKSWGWI